MSSIVGKAAFAYEGSAAMILIGRNRSPFSRRVAVSLRVLGFDYEHRPFTAWSNFSEVRKVNPVGRVPALILDNGETLFDSGAILDYLDTLVGQERALVPAREPERHDTLRIVACAMGALEKVVAALYAQTMYPPEKVHQPWIDHNKDQARSGLQWLDNLPEDRWFANDKLSQAEITTVIVLDFTQIVLPGLLEGNPYRRLERLRRKCEPMPAFRDTFPSDAIDQSNPTLPTSAS